MATQQREPLRALTAAEQTTLQHIAKASSQRLDRVRRARALLAVAQGQPFLQAAGQAGFGSGTAVAALVERFNRQGLAALSIASGRGRKPTGPAALGQKLAPGQTWDNASWHSSQRVKEWLKKHNAVAKAGEQFLEVRFGPHSWPPLPHSSPIQSPYPVVR